VRSNLLIQTGGRISGLFVLWAFMNHALANDAICENNMVSIWAGPVQSSWYEYSSVGETLLTEHGQLIRAAAAWRASCGYWSFQLEGSRTTGHRRYLGVTNLKQPVETTSGIRSNELDAQLWHPLRESWSWGGRYLMRMTERDLKSVGLVQGYTERYNQTSLALGLQHTLDVASHGRIQSHIWLGSGMQGNLHVTLPSMDSAILRLGPMHYWAAGVQWSGCRTEETKAGWNCEIAMEYQSERSAHGPAQAVYRNGVLHASASQPATLQKFLIFKLGALYRFK
jgi:hypothetical protein